MSTAPPGGRLRGGGRRVVAGVRRELREHDLLLYAAGTTFYAAVAAVPLLLVSTWLCGQLLGEATVLRLGEQAARLLPRVQGAEAAAGALAEAGTSLSAGTVLASLLPGTLYAEGLVRAFERLSHRDGPGPRGLRSRLLSPVLFATTPAALLLALLSTSALTRALGEGTGARLLGVYLAFLVAWVGASIALAVAYRLFGPDHLGPRALAWGAASTGSVVAGFLLGFVLFLGLDLDLGAAFGGSAVLASAASTGLWLYLLHVLVLGGYLLTVRLQGEVLLHGEPQRSRQR